MFFNCKYERVHNRCVAVFENPIAVPLFINIVATLQTSSAISASLPPILVAFQPITNHYAVAQATNISISESRAPFQLH